MPAKPFNPNAAANLDPMARLEHGAHSPAKVAAASERHLTALRERFPNADVTILSLQASRLAQLELVGAWLEPRGVIRNTRTGTIYPAALYWWKVASAFERTHERLAEQERAVTNPSDRRLADELAEARAVWERREAIDAGEVADARA
jgi:hypothetical protein